MCEREIGEIGEIAATVSKRGVLVVYVASAPIKL